MIPASRMSGLTAIATLALLLAAAGCSQSTTSSRELTQRQRDSTLGKSVLPGSFVVTRALKTSDQASAAAKQLDAQAASDAP